MKLLAVIVLLCTVFLHSFADESDFQNTFDDEMGQFSNVLVSTIDGYLRALDSKTGNIKWSIQEEPVLRSPSIVKQGFTFLPSPLDGSLYILRDSVLKKLPLNIPQLVHASPTRGTDGVLYAGSKKDVWFGIDPLTGVKVETLSSSSADRICPANKRHTVFVGRTEFRVSMFDENNRAKTWNATFNDYSAHLLPENNKYQLKHYVSSSSGNILAVDRVTGEIKWEQDLKQPIVALYLLENDGLHKLPFTVLGKETMENIVKSAYAYQLPSMLGDASPSQQTSSIAPSFYPTLYVGESPFGLYAIGALVDRDTITYSPKFLGPPLLEGPAPIALSAAEKEAFVPPRRPIVRDIVSITHKTIDGEYLLLGYHEPPSMHLGTIIPTRFPNFGHLAQQGLPFHGNNNDQRQIAGPTDENEATSLSSIVLQIYSKYPNHLFAALATVACLLIAVVWMCGKQWGASAVITFAGETRSAQTSKQSNNGRLWYFTKSEQIPDGWMNVGKLLYNPAEVLGRGCEGTVVFRGKFDGREVAVKRVVSEFVRFVDREADLLRESDAHPHVIRYFCMEADSQFRYLALELCVSSLHDYVENAEVRETIQITPMEILRQATDGLAHLHASKIVHRDMKPQNVLLSAASLGRVRAVISDFGLCKRIQPGRNSLSRNLKSGLAGTEGWIAPEALVSESTSYPVDVFSLGCIFYYVLSGGAHPFGPSLRRQANIVNGEFNLDKLTASSDNAVCEVLISSMLTTEPTTRPNTKSVLNHPFFWSAERRLAFFGDVSDRVEKEEDGSPVVRRLESDARAVVCGGWREKICEPLKEDLRKFRTYKSHSVRDLLRAMRNKKHHYRELPEAVRDSLGHIPDQFLEYFTSRFPKLLLHSYVAMEWCASEPVFKGYYSDEVRSQMIPLIEEEERLRKENAENMNSTKWARGQHVRNTPEPVRKSTPKVEK